MSWCIIGSGYTGRRLAAALRRDGDDVVEGRRVPEPGQQRVDLRSPATLDGLIAPGAVVVHLAPPGPDDAGERNLAAAAAAAGARRIVYVSTTGVYAAAAGAWVDETFPTEPLGDRGHARLAAERALLDGPVEAVVLRAPGIYGPGRGVHARLLAGTYRIIGDGDSHVSRIHVDDLAGAIACAGRASVLPSRIYNVADDEPTTSLAVAEALARQLGVPVPPRVPADQVPAEVAVMLTADRRVSNARLEAELGWRPRYPTWREGVAASLAEESEESAELQ